MADDKASKEDIETATKELNDVLMPIGAKMYEQAQAEAPSETPSEESSSETKTDKKKKDDKDAPIEGEVVD